MYSSEFQESLKAVEAAREANIAYEPVRMTAKEKDDLLAAYHPDYKKEEFSELKIGPNKGEFVPHELCELLEAHSRISAEDVDLSDVKYDVDVLIIGGGGAGASCAIEADEAGVKTAEKKDTVNELLKNIIAFCNKNTTMDENSVKQMATILETTMKSLESFDENIGVASENTKLVNDAIKQINSLIDSVKKNEE